MGDPLMSGKMSDHRLEGTFTADGPTGGIDLKEIECGGTFVLVEFGMDYCPKCGDEL